VRVVSAIVAEQRASRMRWRRGLLRLWIVIALAWVAGIGAFADPIDRIFHPLSFYQGDGRITLLRQAGFGDDEIADYFSKSSLTDLAKLAILPPLFLLAIGCGGIWIARGFMGPGSN
jgi:hypothetical protein